MRGGVETSGRGGRIGAGTGERDLGSGGSRRGDCCRARKNGVEAFVNGLHGCCRRGQGYGRRRAERAEEVVGAEEMVDVEEGRAASESG